MAETTYSHILIKKELCFFIPSDHHQLHWDHVPHDCRIEPDSPCACCRPSSACRCRGNSNNRTDAGMTPFSSSASLFCCWLWCGLWGFTCITAASGSTFRPLLFLSTSEFASFDMILHTHVAHTQHTRTHAACKHTRKCIASPTWSVPLKIN